MYRWSCEGITPDELEAAGLAREFDSQQLAEDWLSAFYPELQEIGVSRVSLLDGERVVYGPMSLDA